MLDLRTARELAGLSQDALAEETGITHVTITHLENGHHKPQKRTREVMEAYFGQELLWNRRSTRAYAYGKKCGIYIEKTGRNKVNFRLYGRITCTTSFDFREFLS